MSYFHQKKFQKKIGRKFIRVRRFRKSDPDPDPDPVKNCPDPQHCLET
jgi:hypothetical protein